MKTLILLALPLLASATTLNDFVGDYSLIDGDRDCFQEFNVFEGEYYGFWGDDMVLTRIAPDEVNSGVIEYEDKITKSSIEVTLEESTLRYKEKGVDIWVPFSLDMKLTLEGDTLYAKIKSFHQTKFLWDSLSCSYGRE